MGFNCSVKAVNGVCEHCYFYQDCMDRNLLGIAASLQKDTNELVVIHIACEHFFNVSEE